MATRTNTAPKKKRQRIQKKLEHLPAAAVAEVDAYIDSWLPVNSKQENFLGQDWAGALKTFKSVYTSMSLQKKSLEWRNGFTPRSPAKQITTYP